MNSILRRTSEPRLYPPELPHESLQAEAITTIAQDLAVIAVEDRAWARNWKDTGVKEAADSIPDRISPRQVMYLLNAVMQKLDPEMEDFHFHLDEAIAGLGVQVAKVGMDEAEAYSLICHPNRG